MIKKLSSIVGVSGFEYSVRKFIINELSELGADISIDNMGNLFAKCINNPEYPTVVLSTNMDEAGFIITDITDDGYLKFDIIGDINHCDLISKRVKIGDTTGIIALKAIHLTTKEEREKPIKITDLFIDIGAKTKVEAEEVTEIGDYCAFESRATDFGPDALKGKALASRVGCAILVDILKNNSYSNINLICVFTTQKNVRGRGAVVASNRIDKAECLIVTDGFPAKLNSALVCGKGAVVSATPDDTEKSRKLFDAACDIAKEENIPMQRCIFSKNSDLAVYKARRNDISSVAIGFPVKYINTPTEIAEKADIKACCDIICGVLSEVSNGKNL